MRHAYRADQVELTKFYFSHGNTIHYNIFLLQAFLSHGILTQSIIMFWMTALP